MSPSVWIVNLAILSVVLYTDLGRRPITMLRLLRPVVLAALIVPFYLHGIATEGNGALLELVGTAVGAAVGAVAVALINIERDPLTHRAYSRAGLGYALLWSGVTAGRLLFGYGSEHMFGAQLGRFMYRNQISVDALTAALIMMAVAMVLTRTASLWIRSRARAAATPTRAAEVVVGD